MAWRLFQLARVVDLSRLFGKISFLGEKPFVWIQRKGWLTPKWEEVFYLPNLPALCPWQLLQAYVKLTHLHCAEGTEVLRTLHTPFSPLSSNTIGSITSKLLDNFGIKSFLRNRRALSNELIRNLPPPLCIHYSLGLTLDGCLTLRCKFSQAGQSNKFPSCRRVSEGSTPLKI